MKDKEVTKRNLINAVGDIINTSGFNQVKISKVAKAAGVDRKLIYRYFGNLNNLVEAFMLKNFRYNISLEQFAKLSGRSLTSFKREFVEIFNSSPANWLKNKRLSEAYALIAEKSLKPDDIYYDLGFENLSHFYTAFKQKYGMTPAESKTQQTQKTKKNIQ